MGLMFFPRGGSSQVARYLARSLPESGWDVTLACGSLGPPGAPSHAATFFAGLDVRALDFDARPPRRTRSPPTRPSTRRTRTARARRTASSPALDDDGVRAPGGRPGGASSPPRAPGEADVLHLHHLTPINEAAERDFPELPRIGHLHGTELLMLREIDEGPPEGWAHAERWAERMRRWAAGCERLLVLSPDAVRRVPDLLGVAPETGGLGAERLRPQRLPARPSAATERLAHWRRWLVEEPRGWDESGEPGQRGLLRGAARAVPRRRAGAALRGPLHRGQAHPAPHSRARARAGALRAAARRWCCSAASRASGRGSTRWRSCARPGTRTCSSPAGAATRTCPPGSTPPTCWCSPPCTSSSAPCSWRRWRAACR